MTNDHEMFSRRFVDVSKMCKIYNLNKTDTEPNENQLIRTEKKIVESFTKWHKEMSSTIAQESE